MKKLARIKSWNEMLEICDTDISSEDVLQYNKDDYFFNIAIEKDLPEDRIIELDEDDWRGWGFSDWMIAEYLDDLDSPDHPANQTLLPELDEFRKDTSICVQIPEPDIKQVKSDNFKVLKSLRKSASRIHYYKFALNFSEDYSIRYFLEFEDRPELVREFVMKSHSKREYSVIPRSMAEDLIGKLCEIPCEEVIGRRINKNYEKIVISENKLVRFTE